MKAVIFAAFFVNSIFSGNFAYAQSADNVIEGCEGEGCGCTNESKTNKDFVLHEKMDSRKIGECFYTPVYS